MKKSVALTIFLIMIIPAGTTLAIEQNSIKDNLPLHGLTIEGNSIVFNQEGLPTAQWNLPGEFEDIKLISTNVKGDIEENVYQIIYQQEDYKYNLILTQRILPTNDQFIFFQITAPDIDGQVKVELEQSNRIYGSESFKYIDNGQLHTLIEKKPFSYSQEIYLEKGYSLDQWYIFSNESLELNDSISKDAWETSLNFHQTNTWVTPYGTHRYTPAEYLDKQEYTHKNINLQASSPLLILEALEQSSSRLLEDFVHNAQYTLKEMQDDDGFWRTKLNVAYLDRSYGLGNNFIDTRMSVDASLFLLRYGILYDDKEAISKGTNFKNYFKMLKEKDMYYEYNTGVIYPDYYSETARTKTLVSLNHALYEMNYLYTLYNWLGDKEAKDLADEMLNFIKLTYKDWLNDDGDLYYALSHKGEYYGGDYENVTYIDLFILESILNYMNMDTTEISFLFQEKGKYLNKINSKYPESHLQYEDVLNNFDQSTTQKGNITFSYPVEIKWDEGADIAYTSYGAYHFVKGAKSVSYKGNTSQIDSSQKYMVILTEDSLHYMKRKQGSGK